MICISILDTDEILWMVSDILIDAQCPMLGYKNLEVLEIPYKSELRHWKSLREPERTL